MPLWQPTLFPEGYLINVSKTLIKTNSQEEKAMIISDLNYMETAEANVEGGTFWVSGNRFNSSYTQTDKIDITFTSKNTFATTVNSPSTTTNSAAAGAKGDAINNTFLPTYRL
jgi:hypothetical protein